MSNEITRLKRIQIIRDGIEKEFSTSKIRKELSDNDLGYRYQNILKDVRHQKALYHVTAKQKIDNVDNWFENVFERFRTENDLNSKQTSRYWEMAVYQSAELIEEAELSANFWDMYKEIFGDDT